MEIFQFIPWQDGFGHIQDRLATSQRTTFAGTFDNLCESREVI